MYIEMITALGKVVDISDICNFYRRCILPICWRNPKFGRPQKNSDIQQISVPGL
jgi:hypothetical protein